MCPECVSARSVLACSKPPYAVHAACGRPRRLSRSGAANSSPAGCSRGCMPTARRRARTVSDNVRPIAVRELETTPPGEGYWTRGRWPRRPASVTRCSAASGEPFRYSRIAPRVRSSRRIARNWSRNPGRRGLYVAPPAHAGAQSSNARPETSGSGRLQSRTDADDWAMATTGSRPARQGISRWSPSPPCSEPQSEPRPRGVAHRSLGSVYRIPDESGSNTARLRPEVVLPPVVGEHLDRHFHDRVVVRRER